MSRRYFISFANEDRTWATWVASVAASAGYEVTFQDWDFAPGNDFVREINDGLVACDAVVAVFSASYFASQWAQAELWSAVARDPSGKDRRLIPIRVEDCNPEGLLKSRVYVDLVGREAESARRLLLNALADESSPVAGGYVASAAGSPGFPGASDPFEEYRSWSLAMYGRVDLMGLASDEHPCDLEEVFVPLRMEVHGLDMEAPLSQGGRRSRGSKPYDTVGRDVGLDRAFEVATQQRELAIIGEAGTGKTMVLRKMLHQTITRGGASLGLHPDTVPVFLRLRRLRPEHLSGSMAMFLADELHTEAPGRFPSSLGSELWQRGNLLLLLDGLDEIANESARSDAIRFVERQLMGSSKRGIRACVSSRRSGLSRKVRIPGFFMPLELRPLNNSQVERFVQVWFRAAHRAESVFPEQWESSDAEARTSASRTLTQLSSKFYARQELLGLIGTPFLLTLLCIVALRRHEVPQRRASFYEQCLDVMLSQWYSVPDTLPPIDEEHALGLLRSVAWFLHSAGRRDDLTRLEFQEIVNEALTRICRRVGRTITSDQVLVWFQERASVLEEFADDRLGFSHLGLQEYLTAAYIAREMGDSFRRLVSEFGADWWREVTLLFAGLARHAAFEPLMREIAARGSVVEHIGLLQRCLDEANEIVSEPFATVIRDPNTEEARVSALLRVFVGRRDPEIAAAAMRAMEYRGGEITLLAQSLAAECGITIDGSRQEESNRASERTRLGRVFVEDQSGTRFVEVPDGLFMMGSDDLWKACRPVHPVKVSRYFLGETPVTNRQYARFLDVTDTREPKYWRNRRFNSPNQPVVGVSWHEAIAYCAWLARLTNLKISLPTEAQREYASRDTDGRRYPWGNSEPENGLAVFGLDGQIGEPAAVGSLPSGRGPFGHLDLAGEVWEWCMDSWDENAYSKRLRSETFGVADPVVAESTVERVLRGGGWRSPREDLHAARRIRFDADDRNYDFGFRLALSSAPAGWATGTCDA